eukprot:2319329-Rhodomonas_salina.1
MSGMHKQRAPCEEECRHDLKQARRTRICWMKAERHCCKRANPCNCSCDLQRKPCQTRMKKRRTIRCRYLPLFLLSALAGSVTRPRDTRARSRCLFAA